MSKLNLGIIFGIKSVEHEVSIVTTFQAWDWIDPSKYNRYLIYIDQENQPFLCPEIKKENYHHFIDRVLAAKKEVEFIKNGIKTKSGLAKKIIKLDVALLVMHGAYGEDGRIQGLLDFYGIPFTGPGVLGSALGIDKVSQKDIFKSLNLPIAPYFWFYDYEYQSNPINIQNQIQKLLKYPLFIKPACGGSSVGIIKVKSVRDLDLAIKKTSNLDHKILIEQGIDEAIDINCAVRGGYPLRVTPCEQPLSDDQFLSFKEKYLKGGKTKGMAGLSRIIPAPIPDKVALSIQETAKIAFRELGCWGMVRIDFLYNKKTNKFFINEVNTIPGSLAFYLWQASGLEPEAMIDEMINLALEKEKQIASQNYLFRSEILNQK